MKGTERRAFSAELRVEGGGDTEPTRIVGHAAVFDKLSEDLGGFREKIAPGTFANTIKKDDVRALFNHSPDIVLGRNKAGTLELDEDKKGLAISINPPDTSAARDLIVSLERGDIDQMSFGFRTIDDRWEDQDKKTPIRTLLEVKLLDVSPVTFPAYPQTDVGLRSYLGLDEALRSLDAWKQDQVPVHRLAAARRLRIAELI